MKYSSGVSDVFVNGAQVLRNGEHTNARPGRVVRGPGWTGETRSTLGSGVGALGRRTAQRHAHGERHQHGQQRQHAGQTVGSSGAAVEPTFEGMDGLASTLPSVPTSRS